MRPLVEPTEHGLYCAAGDFHVDPWRPVPRAVVTHAHADHAAWGCDSYLCAARGREVLAQRLSPDARIQPLEWNTPLDINGVGVSLHPAGHILGSAQVRLEHRGAVTVVSGDYKTDPDPTCDPFEPVRCDVFITESTFGLPIYRWPAQRDVFNEINEWWRDCQAQGRTAVLFSYALGKAQRLLAGIDPSIGPILVHGAMTKFDEPYRAAGVDLPETIHATADNAKQHKGRALVLAPPSANDARWLRKFGPVSLAMASGWMRIRGTRRRRSLDRGFVLSDHCDWPGLLHAIRETDASSIGVTHGAATPLARHLESFGLHSFVVPTRYTGDADEPADNESKGEDA
ncbi:MAG: ligase-associated DNA damage response exonuclease [Phycisphaerales bacterium]